MLNIGDTKSVLYSTHIALPHSKYWGFAGNPAQIDRKEAPPSAVIARQLGIIVKRIRSRVDSQISSALIPGLDPHDVE